MPSTKPQEHEFEVRENGVVHTPTGWAWRALSPASDLGSWDEANLKLADGRDYREDLLHEMANRLWSKRRGQR